MERVHGTRILWALLAAEAEYALDQRLHMTIMAMSNIGGDIKIQISWMKLSRFSCECKEFAVTYQYFRLHHPQAKCKVDCEIGTRKAPAPLGKLKIFAARTTCTAAGLDRWIHQELRRTLDMAWALGTGKAGDARVHCCSRHRHGMPPCTHMACLLQCPRAGVLAH